VVRCNNQTVWVLPRSFHPAGADVPFIGRAPWGLAGFEPSFSGRIVAVQPVRPFASAPLSPFEVAPYWLQEGEQSAYGAVRLHFTVPIVSAPRIEPLLVTGASPVMADHVIITTAPPAQVSFGYVHASAAGLQTMRTMVDAAKTQVVEIDVPSLYPAESSDFFATQALSEILALRRGRARIRLNGRLLIDSPVQAFDSPAGNITIGVDHLNQPFGSRFSGKIAAIERTCLQAPDGLFENSGPLELKFTWPEVLNQGAETLLATGAAEVLDRLLVEYPQAGRAVFVVRTVLGAKFTSRPVIVDSAAHTLRISWGGLNPDAGRPANVPPSEWRLNQRKIRVSLDGVSLIDDMAALELANPQALILGGATEGATAFTGIIQSVRRLAR
jgi:hypothetical protein